MALECPHCFCQIIPLNDGRCPACREDTRRMSSDPDRRTLQVTEKAQLPAICCTCGEPSRRVVGITHSHHWGPVAQARCTEEDAGEAATTAAVIFGGITGAVIGMAMFAYLRMSGGQQTSATVHVRMRQCKRCTAAFPLKPLQVEYNFFTMRFVVCHAFADEYELLNPRTTADRRW